MATKQQREDAAFWRQTAEDIEQAYRRGDYAGLLGLCDYARGYDKGFTPEQRERRCEQLWHVKLDGGYGSFYWPFPDNITTNSPWARPVECADDTMNNRILAALLLAAAVEAGDLEPALDTQP